MENQKCRNGCERYNKSIDEIAQAASKHRNATVSLKSICEKQKLKISNYKERVDSLELEVQKYDTYASEMVCKNEKLENTIRILTTKLKNKNTENNISNAASEEEFDLKNDQIKQLEEDVQIGFDMCAKYRKQVNEMNDTLMEEKKKFEEQNEMIEVF